MTGRTEKWISNLIEGLDNNLDEKTIAKILEQCGRQCQSPSFIKKAKAIYEKSKNTDDFLKKLEQVYKHLHREGNKVYIVYPKCYCPQVNKIPKGKLQEPTATAHAAGPKHCLKEPQENPLKSTWKNPLSTETTNASLK